MHGPQTFETGIRKKRAHLQRAWTRQMQMSTIRGLRSLQHHRRLKQAASRKQHLSREHGLFNKAIALQEHHVTGGLPRQHHHDVTRHQPP